MQWQQIALVVGQLAVLLGVAVKLWRTPALNTKDRADGFRYVQEGTADLLEQSVKTLQILQQRVSVLENRVKEQNNEINQLVRDIAKTKAELERARERIKELEQLVDEYKKANTVLTRRLSELLSKPNARV